MAVPADDKEDEGEEDEEDEGEEVRCSLLQSRPGPWLKGLVLLLTTQALSLFPKAAQPLTPHIDITHS
jgi:hypothetical protein